MSYYRKWIPQEIIIMLQRTWGLNQTQKEDGSYSKYAGIDDGRSSLFYAIYKVGMGRATWDAAQEIRTNIITRDEGIILVKKYDHEYQNIFK